jgi:hypothetical protein
MYSIFIEFNQIFASLEFQDTLDSERVARASKQSKQYQQRKQNKQSKQSTAWAHHH